MKIITRFNLDSPLDSSSLNAIGNMQAGNARASWYSNRQYTIYNPVNQNEVAIFSLNFIENFLWYNTTPKIVDKFFDKKFAKIFDSKQFGFHAGIDLLLQKHSPISSIKEPKIKHSADISSKSKCVLKSQLNPNINQLIVNQLVDSQAIKKKIIENAESIKSKDSYISNGDWNYLLTLLPAFVKAEKTRMYFNQQGIPVGYSARGFEDYVFTSLLKNQVSSVSSDYVSSKRVKPLVVKTKEVDLNHNDFSLDTSAHVFSLFSNLYDSSIGESHIYSMMVGEGLSLREEHIEAFIGNTNKANQIYSLYKEYKQKLVMISAEKLLYTVAFTDLNHNKNILRLSFNFGALHKKKPKDINAYLLECNQKTSIKSQYEDCPQLRAFKPGVNKDTGIRMIRCYSSKEQKKLHKEFKKKLKVILS